MVTRWPFVGLPNQTPERQGVLFFVCAWILLLWPLAVNHTPFYFGDSPSYLRGGAFGFDTGLAIFRQHWDALVGAVPNAGAGGGNGDQREEVAGAIAASGGMRSVIYSLMTYLLRAPGQSLLNLAVAQAGAVALVMAMTRSVVAPSSRIGPSLGVAVAIAFFTSAAWYAAFIVPDIWAGILIAAALALTLYLDRLNTPSRVLMILIIALGITVHGSHLPVALSVVGAGSVAHFWLNGYSRRAFARKIVWFASPVLLAMAALFATSYVAFGETSLAPKRYPILLARSVADGPGAWHLRDHCAIEHYAICEIFGPTPPRKVGQFLWADSGVRHRASPDQMERIRAEESLIIGRAALEYPVEQATASIGNALRQLFTLGVKGLVFGEELSGDARANIIQVGPDRPTLRAIGDVSVYLSFGASLLVLLVLRRRLTSTEVAALAVATVGLLSNAAVCGILSGVTDRYQGRVAWVVPMLTGFILLRLWSERRDPPGQQQPLHR